MTELIFRGMKRRKKDVVYIILVSFIVTFFMSGILMFQSILDSYVREKNRDTYGDWVIASESSELSHPYLAEKGSVSNAVYLCDQEGAVLGKTLGSISAELMDFGHIGLYEGHMPENETEIVSDLQTLQRLGYSYDLGQQITIRWNEAALGEEKVIREKSYTLVGTIKPFNQLWSSQRFISYPNLFVTDQEMQSYEKEVRTIWFYRLDPARTDIDPEEFYKGFQESNQETPLVFNSYVYGSTIWGSDGAYKLAIGMMIVLAVFAISFVLSAYVDRRRSAYFRLRMIGCPRIKLNGIIFTECSLPTVLPAVLGLGLSYLAGAIVCRIIAKSVGLRGFFGFDGPVFLLQLLAIFGTIVLSILLAMQRTHDRMLSQESKALSKKEIQRIRRALPKLRLPEKELFKRQRLLHPGTRLAAILFTVVVTAFLCSCFGKVITAIQGYRNLKEEPDYVISVRNPEEMARHYLYVAEDGSLYENADQVGYLRRTYFNPYYGPSDADLQVLRSVEGVAGMEGLVWDDMHFLRWEGCEESPRLKMTSGMLVEGTAVYTEVITEATASVNIVSDVGFLKEFCGDLGESFPQEDYEAFKRGELVFVLGKNAPDTLNPETGELVKVPDETLQDGDLLTIFSEHNEDGLKIPVRIIENDSFLWKYYFIVNRGGIPVFVSEGVAEKLRALENPVPEFRKNRFLFRFSALSSFDATDKILASYASSQANGEYFNNAESKRHQMREAVLRPLLIFGSLLLMTTAVFFIVQRNFIEIRGRRNLDSLRRFRKIGMRRRELKKNLLLSECFEAAAVFWGLLGVIVLHWISRVIDYRKTLGGVNQGMTFVNLTKQYTQNPYLAATDRLISWDTVFTILLVALLFAALSLFGYAISRKMFESEEVL